MLLNFFQANTPSTAPIPKSQSPHGVIHISLSSPVECFLIVTLFALLPSSLSIADEKPSFQSGVDVGVIAIDDDVFISTIVEQRFRFRGFSMILQGPFRLRIADQSPSDTGPLRKQDWDQPSDFARIVPHLAYRQIFADGFVDLYAGELNNITIGTGSTVSHYYNSVDMDRFCGGVASRGEYRGNGLALLLDDVIAPALFAGRFYIAPAAWFTNREWAKRVSLEFIFGGDFKAPLRAYAHEDRILTATGGAIRGIVVDNEHLTIQPSIHVMAMDGDPGIHAGAHTTWIVSRPKKIAVSLYGEYRYSGSDYHPALFNPFYNFNRFHYTLPDSPPDTTFADHQSYGTSLPAAHGFMFDLSFEWQHRFQLGAVYDRIGDHRTHWVMFYANLTPLKGYQLRGFYAGQDLSGGMDLFSRSSIFGIESRGKIWGPLDLFFYFTRRWRDVPNVQSLADEFGGGMGAAVSY